MFTVRVHMSFIYLQIHRLFVNFINNNSLVIVTKTHKQFIIKY